MKDRIKGHWNTRSREYDKNVRQVIYFRRDKRVWQRTLAGALGSEPLRVLDVGTGPGIMANMLAEMGHQVTGIDVSEGMLKRARDNSSSLHNSLEFVLGDAENLPFEGESFDAVVNRYVLWTIPDPKRALAEWRRILKPGGRMVIIDGTWYLRTADKPLRNRIWQHLSVPLIMLTERRVPRYQDMDDDLMARLWSSNARRPEADIGILEDLGFEEIDVDGEFSRRLMTNLDHLKNGHCGEYFLIRAVK